MTIKIGYLGPRGTFTEEAMEMWIETQKSDTINEYTRVEHSSIPKLINALDAGDLDEAVVPVENSLEGSVNITVDMLIHEANVMVKGELVIPIRQCLLAKENMPLENVEEIFSHPQALYQSIRFINDRLPQAKANETLSTAEAAKMVAERGKSVAAVGSRRLAEIYGLKILAEDIQGQKNNLTRFYVLSANDAARTGRDKTALAFSTENRPGSLFRSLGVFAQRNLNLTKIESRPSKRMLGEYVFFIEVEGHREDGVLKHALETLKQHAGFIKLLGSYPAFCDSALCGKRDEKMASDHLLKKRDVYEKLITMPVRKAYPPAGGEELV
ncbi:MAG: prephenate dehydratase [Tepidanaerobacteraceae bacterium]|nr:prephenate dehydratase [Tepidanaerobacteraceae bacterium]